MFQVAQSPTYLCTKCDCMTSGIILQDKPKDRRWCLCGKPLLCCNHCNQRISGTIQGESIICDGCGNSVSGVALIVGWIP